MRRAVADVAAMGGTPRYRHASNSAGLLRDSRVWHDLVRPGLLLYGIVPPPLASTLALEPVMRLTSRVVAVKGMRTGEITGYGGRFTAERPTTLAIVPAGYADGLDLRARGITVSTVGLRAGIRRLADEALQVGLTISLHAPDDELRRRLIPTSAGTSIDDLVEGARDYIERRGRRVTFAYALLDGVNDSEEQARRLADRIRGVAELVVDEVPVPPHMVA